MSVYKETVPQESHPWKRVAANLMVSAIALAGCASEQEPLSVHSESIEVLVDAPSFIDAPQIWNKAEQADKTLAEKREKGDVALLTVARRDNKFVATEVAEGISLDELQPLEKVVTDNSLWINTAMDDGTLKEVRFKFIGSSMDGISKDGEPQYQEPQTGDNAGPGVISFPLPVTDKLSTQHLSLMLHHELAHALTARLNIFDSVDTSTLDPTNSIAVDKKAYTRLCESVRNDGVDDASEHLVIYSNILEKFNQMAAMLHSERWKQTVMDMRAAIVDGTYDKYQPQQGDAASIHAVIIQACQVETDPSYTLHRVMDALDSPTDYTKDKKRFDLEINIDSTFETAIVNHSLYRVLRENTYLSKSQKHDDRAGHPWDNLDELMASYLNVVTEYPEQVRQNIANLPQDEQKLLRNLLEQITTDVTRAHADELEFVAEIQQATAIVLK